MSDSLQDYQKQFIEFALSQGVLKFGEFELKSGRKSPYFFNAGLFNDGNALAKLGEFYAATIHHQAPQFDLVFGPAYKGIPLGTTAVVGLSNLYQVNKPFCFNRKEAKDHGEGGSLVGAPLEGRVLIVDDVITAGTAIREVMAIIQQAGAEAAAVVVAVDRQERGKGELSAIQEVEKEFGIPVLSIVNLSQIIEYLKEYSDQYGLSSDVLSKVEAYREQYGIR